VKIDKSQILILQVGCIVISDPAAISNLKPSNTNIATIDKLIEVARKNQ